jgi:hypothetical protein
MSGEPEILDESAIADDQTAVTRRVPVDLLTIPRLLGGALADIRAIAEGMSVLPRLADTLEAIRTQVDSLEDEVKRMRAAVESMGGDVSEVQAGIARVEPHLEEVSKVAHPLRRLGNRARRRDGGS